MTKATRFLHVGISVTTAYETDMLEETNVEIPLEDGKIALHLRPFEVKTIRFVRSSFA